MDSDAQRPPKGLPEPQMQVAVLEPTTAEAAAEDPSEEGCPPMTDDSDCLPDDVRAICEAAQVELDRLRAVDPTTLSDAEREKWETVTALLEQLLVVSDDETFRLVVEACERAGRVLSPEELRGLVVWH